MVGRTKKTMHFFTCIILVAIIAFALPARVDAATMISNSKSKYVSRSEDKNYRYRLRFDLPGAVQVNKGKVYAIRPRAYYEKVSKKTNKVVERWGETLKKFSITRKDNKVALTRVVAQGAGSVLFTPVSKGATSIDLTMETTLTKVKVSIPVIIK